MRKLCLFVVLLSASMALAQSQPQGPLAVSGGDTIQVITNTALTDKDDITVTLTPVPKAPQGGCEVVTIQPIGSPAAKLFSFSIPAGTCIGKYQISAAKTSEPKVINISSPQQIQVNERPPVVTGIDPTVLYSSGQDAPSSWQLAFLGPPTLKAGKDLDYKLRFKDHALPLCQPQTATKTSGAPPTQPPAPPPASAPPDPKDSDQPCYSLLTSTDGQISFLVGGGGFLAKFQGKQVAWLELNGAQSAPQSVHIVDASRNTPRNYAFGITAALLVLVYLLLSSGSRSMQTATGRRTTLLTKLFMDEETKSYSLSKCQFFAWTFAAILGYIFLAVSKSIVQGSAVFPDIPDGLPGIILYSAGTSVLSTWITNTRGSKGAGEDTPNLADFITTGGVVAPERLQFVVWTITGIFTFLTIVLKSDPMTVSDLPRIPDGFMNLMGISSVGYLAGKLARKPGPVISTLAVAKVTEQADETKLGDYKPPDASPAKGHIGGDVLTLGLQGEGLSLNASIKVDGNPLRTDQFWINGVADPQTGFCKSLNVSLNNAAPYLEGSHTLTLVNPDAQAADAKFPIDPMKITSALTVAPGSDAVEVKVTGESFVADTSAEWKGPGATTPAPIDKLAAGTTRAQNAEAVVFNSKNSISVWLKPGTTEGSGELTLISPVRLRARTTVAVKKP